MLSGVGGPSVQYPSKITDANLKSTMTAISSKGDEVVKNQQNVAKAAKDDIGRQVDIRI